MRMLRSVEDVGENLTRKSSLAPVRNLWNEWEIHCLILTSLALQFILFFTAGMRRHSTSRVVLGTVLWLAYLSADSVAIFVLGHLAVRGGPEHELLLFWAPFMLVHLGGQDTITALSVQDNVLWTRHLLGFVSQVAVAGYVVSKSSWPDSRLLVATVLVFLAGSFKYAGRTYCLYSARPANLKVATLCILSDKLDRMDAAALLEGNREVFGARFDLMLGNTNKRQPSVIEAAVVMSLFPVNYAARGRENNDAMEIMSADAPVNDVSSFVVADDLPRMLEQFRTTPSLRGPYEYVGGKLEKCYEIFYTKRPLLDVFKIAFDLLQHLIDTRCLPYFHVLYWLTLPWLMATTMFQYLSTPIALVLFILAEKGQQVHNRADIIVTYILLVGAIILDVSSFSMSILTLAKFSHFQVRRSRTVNAILCVTKYIQPSCCRKQWSEKLAQYNMVKKYTMEDTRGMSCAWQRTSKHLATWGVELDPSLTHTPVTEDLKGFVLDTLVQFGISRQYNFANFRGQLALEKWRQNSGSGPGVLYNSINGEKDFPTSVLIWHIATDICYYCGNRNMANTDPEKLMKKKQMSRELSNYMLYLVFKCGVMLTTNSQLVYHKAHEEMQKILIYEESQTANLGEKEAVKKVFDSTKGEQPSSTMIEAQEEMEKILIYQESQPANLGEKEAVKKVFDYTKGEQPSSTVIEEREEPVRGTYVHLTKLMKRTAESIYSPVLPRASKVAQELMGIDGEDGRWDLVAAVWLEMLYYTAPRCGGAFHYEHLATGGEFSTHVLLLMRSLGPFLPGA